MDFRTAGFDDPYSGLLEPRVLLVERDTHLRLFFVEILRDLGFTVLWCTEPGNALVHCRLEPIDLIVINFGPSPSQYLHRIERFLALDPMPSIIVCSGMPLEPVVGRLLDPGRLEFLHLPDVVRDLPGLVAGSMALRPGRTQDFQTTMGG